MPQALGNASKRSQQIKSAKICPHLLKKFHETTFVVAQAKSSTLQKKKCM
jgi:hypothetical protein